MVKKLAWLVAFAFLAGIASICWWMSGTYAKAEDESAGARLELKNITASGSKKLDFCSHWRFALVAGTQLDPSLNEMSGLAYSKVWEDVMYHITDSGNEPKLLLTNGQGQLLGKFIYGEKNSDAEDVAVGPCPWGGSCVYVADTGDNFHLRSQRQLFLLEESRLLDHPRTQTVALQFADGGTYDVEALAVHPKVPEVYLFTKERARTQVFSANMQAINSSTLVLHKVGEVRRSMVTGAAFHPSGERLLLINFQGALELARQYRPGFDHTYRNWFAYQRKIELPSLVQQEAIAYDPQGRDIIYSSEKKSWSQSPWGLGRGSCLDRPDAGRAQEVGG